MSHDLACTKGKNGNQKKNVKSEKIPAFSLIDQAEKKYLHMKSKEK